MKNIKERFDYLKFTENILGINLKWYQKLAILLKYKYNKTRKPLFKRVSEDVKQHKRQILLR